MRLVEDLYDHFYARALGTKVAHLCIGLRYTAVVTESGGTGVAFTYREDGHCCPMRGSYRDYEGEGAAELLGLIKSPAALERSMALALINALNHDAARGLPEDPADSAWMDSFGIGSGSRVAMVGLFRPLMKILKERGAVVEVSERRPCEAGSGASGGGEEVRFHAKLGEWAEVLILTATSILNDTAEDVLSRVGPGVKVIMIGPSTPMAAEAFGRLPVRVLAGTVPVDGEAVLRAVRHGEGTPVIHRFSRKVYMTLPGGGTAGRDRHSKTPLKPSAAGGGF